MIAHLVLIATLFIASSCTDPKENFGQFDAKLKELDAELKRLGKEIKKVIGERACGSDLDCQIIQLGHVSCGYHTHYEVYSIRNTNLRKLKELSTEFNAKDEELNKLSFKVQSCGKPAPGARCYKKTCVKVAT